MRYLAFSLCIGIGGCGGASGGSSDDAVDPGGTDPNRTGTPSPISSDVFASEGNAESKLDFGVPAANGSPITAYEYEVNGDGSWKPLPAPPNAIVKGLVNGVSYTFRVRAVNGLGPSPKPSAPSNAVVPYGIPDPPAVQSTMNGLTVTWTWTPPAANGRTVLGYHTQLDTEEFGPLTQTTTFSETFPNQTKHTFCVRAVTSGAPPRNVSNKGCTDGTVSLPTVKSDPDRDSDGFQNPGADGIMTNDMIKRNQTYTISGACRRSPDIGTNNGWWYRVVGAKDPDDTPWVAATNFLQEMNEFNAPRVAGGNGCN